MPLASGTSSLDNPASQAGRESHENKKIPFHDTCRASLDIRVVCLVIYLPLLHKSKPL